MLGSVISKIFGSKSDKDIKRLQPKVAEINNIYKTKKCQQKNPHTLQCH